MSTRWHRFGAVCLLSLTAFACGSGEVPGESADGAAGQDAHLAAVAGTWRAVLASPGGELPFTLRIGDLAATSVYGDAIKAPALAINGEEQVPFSTVRFVNGAYRLRIDGYDSEIVATLSADAAELSGEWSKTIPDGRSRLPFTATRGQTHRFTPVGIAGAHEQDADVAGTWAVKFTDDEGEETAQAEFHVENGRATGTFLTPVGDYRYLEGDYHDGSLRLSCFDGGHAFLFHAARGRDGTLTGDFWSRDTYHATWTARRATAATAAAEMPDPLDIVTLTNQEGRLRFQFPDLAGNMVSLTDERFRNKVVLVNLFGSWCPNCNDEAPLLARWHRLYRDRGLEIVGLAYEFTGDAERDGAFVRKYGERHGIEFPLLLAGLSDKQKAAGTLPDLSSVAAYPTTIFVGRDGRVRRLHSGFAGPATGAHHTRLVAEFEALIETLLAESEPAG